MKKFLLSSGLLVCSYVTIAQVPDDVLRYSFYSQRGTARTVAIGGAMGSLGGDISSLTTNPAGLAFYKTSELVFTPGAKINNNKFNFRGTNSTSNQEGFNLSTLGYVSGMPSSFSSVNQAFAIGINQIANFNNIASYRGQNNQSSYTEVFAEEASGSRKSLNDILNDSRYAFGTSPAIFTYLVDTFRNASGGLAIRGLPEFLLDQGIALNQQRTVTTKGGISEFSLGYAANIEEQLYLGASVGVPIVNYQRNTIFRESDPSGDKNNRFDFFQLNDDLTTKGAGLNAKLGLIYKSSEALRLGISIHTPTFYSLTDRQSSDMTTNIENARSVNQDYTVSSSEFISGGTGVTKYAATTPWKAIVSGALVFGEDVDVRKQKGFISGEIEYTGYSSAKFSEDPENGNSDAAYYRELKTTINDYYRGAFNFRLGGELKFNTLMVRAGTAYYGNPYRNTADLKANRLIASGGLGYRNYGMFVDLTYAHTINKDVNFPYRLGDKSNTFATQSGSTGNLLLTLGFKL